MVEMHLLRVNEDFREDPIFALGVVTTYDRFMETYTPEEDRAAIFEAICKAQDADLSKYRQDSDRLKELAQSKSLEELLEWMTQAMTAEGDDLQWQVRNIAQNEKFKYSRLFGIGLLTTLELADAEVLKDEARLKETLQALSESLKLPENKLMQDIEVYRANLEKMVQTQQAIADNIAADRKRREQAQAEAEKKAESDSAKAEVETSEPDTSADSESTESTPEATDTSSS